MRLGDLLVIKHGYAFSGENIVEEDNGIVLVTPGNFRIGGGFKEEKCKFFDGDIPADYILKEGDFIVTMTDLSKNIDTLGYCAMVPKSNRTYLHNQRIGLITFKSNKCDSGYIYWLMRTHEYQRSIANTSTGSTVHHTSPKKIYDFELELPPLCTQQRIATILSRYDSLIENYQKQIKLLEEAAQRLYKEWFVDLRFPGYENTPVVDGVPEGWEKRKLEDFVFDSGKRISKKDRDSYECYMPIDYLPKKQMFYINVNSVEQAESSLIAFSSGDIIFGAMRPYFHKVCLARHSGITRTTCFVLRAKEAVYDAFVSMLLFDEETVKYASSISVGTTMPYTRWNDFKKMAIIVPPKDLAKIFNSIVLKILSASGRLANQIRLLTEARDRLLPKLMSGEIEV